MENPMVSICIPVYNGESFLEKTLQSVYWQTFSDYEVIILDNCSTDNTQIIISKFVQDFKFEKITYFKNPTKLNMADNWNKSISLARGKYTKLLCADDLIDPNCLEHQTAILEHKNSSKVVLTFSGRKIIDGNGKTIFKKYGKALPQGILDSNFIKNLCIRYRTNLFGEPCAVLFKTEEFKKTPGFTIQWPFLIDISLWMALLDHGNAYFDNQTLCSFRISKTSGSGKAGVRQICQSMSFFNEIYRRNENAVTLYNYLIGFLIGPLIGLARVVVILIINLGHR